MSGFELRPPRHNAQPGNPCRELQTATYAMEALRELDDFTWAQRLGVPEGLDEDEMIMVITEAAGEYWAARDTMMALRIKLLELMVFAVEREGHTSTRIAKAGGMRTLQLKRWRDSYHRKHDG